MAKLPKKPKLKALPKRPKASASISTWEGYEKRVDAVRKENKKKQSDWKKACAQVEKDRKKRETIVNKTKSLGRI